MNKNLYDILGLTPDASIDDIKQSYRVLAMEHHPDRTNNCKESEELFKEIKYAYEILSNPETRDEYDRTGGIVNKEQQLMKLQANAIELFMQIIDNSDSPEQINVIKSMTDNINMQQINIQNNITKNKSIIKKYEKIIKRIHKKNTSGNDDNIFTMMLKNKIDQSSLLIDGNQKRLLYLDELRKFINEYEFDIDMDIPVMSTTLQNSTSDFVRFITPPTN